MYGSEMESRGIPAASASVSDRMSFIRKVYLLAFSGVAVFFLVAAGIALPALAGAGAARSLVVALAGVPPLVYFFLMLGAAWAAHAMANVPGLNLVAFYAYSAFLGLLSVTLVFAAGVTGGAMILVQALFLTVFAFGGLTAFVFITRKDFSFLGGFLAVGLTMLIGTVFLVLVAQAFGWAAPSGLSLGLSMVGGLVFCGYILYDTSNILHHYATSMVVPAAMAIMVDFVMLFRTILVLLMRRD